MCFRQIHAFLVVLRLRDWPAARYVDDGFHGLICLWVRLTRLSRGKKSQLIAAIMNFTLLRFLISQRVPGTSPLRFTDTLTSHRREPYVEKSINFSLKDNLTVTHLFHISITRSQCTQKRSQGPNVCSSFFRRTNYGYFRIEKDKPKNTDEPKIWF